MTDQVRPSARAGEVIPTVSVEQMREVDRLMIDELHIYLLQMMENAGRALAEQARRLVGGDVRGAQVVVLAGAGGKGGGGGAGGAGGVVLGGGWAGHPGGGT